MIATCPHCQSGFYITPELAGKVINCSKCKKQVRAPDRRGGGPQAPSSDGIPTAIVEETRGEIEERLKTETEARQEAEKNLKQALEEKARAEEQAKTEAQAKTELEEKLKQTGNGAGTDTNALAEIEAKLKDTSRTRDELEKKLKDEATARTKAEARAEAKAEIEKLLKAELEARTKAESQLKAELSAKRKMQARLEEETETRKNAEKTAAAAKARLQEADAAAVFKRPVNLCRGLRRLTFLLSPVAAIFAGMVAYNNGYVLLSPFDRPVHLPLFGEPVYLPLMTLAISAAGLASVWAVYLVLVFIIKGFRQPAPPAEPKRQPTHRQQTEEIAYTGGNRMWRSS